jgi:DNA-binding transcriptional LysR family regulator
MNINTFDFNLLRIFEAVMREGNMTVAGAQLGLTQSAMSHALQRLRQIFNDPLFVRTTRGMKPTAYARTLSGPVMEAIGAIKNALELDVRFDPATSARTFNLLMTDIAELIFFPRLIPYLKQVAPGVSIVSTQMERGHYRDVLELGPADLAIGQMPQMHKDFYQQHLFEEPLICLMRSAHPVIGLRLSMQQFMDAEHISVSAPALVEGLVKRALGKRAAKRKIALHIPHYAVVPMILAQSDLIAVVPEHVGTAFSRVEEFKALPLPFDVAPVQVSQFWHERSHHDPGHRWLRAVISELFMR